MRRGASNGCGKMENGISVKAVERVYRLVLAGEQLDDIETSDDIKHLIREFTKWSTLPASQIAQRSNVPVHVALALRALNRHYKTKRTRAHTSGVVRSADITFAVKRLLLGYSTVSIKSCGICDDAIRTARKCIKALQAGGGTRELYKLGVSHNEAVKLIEFIESHHLIAKPAINV
jgi:hypothetical protein